MKLVRQNEAEECFLEALNELEWKASSENPDV